MCLETCNCVLDKSPMNVIDLTGSPDNVASGGKNWICNGVYSLTFSNGEEVLSPSGWLSDSVIAASQLLILQQFPCMSGLQSPVFQQILAFQVHRQEFVQNS